MHYTKMYKIVLQLHYTTLHYLFHRYIFCGANQKQISQLITHWFWVAYTYVRMYIYYILLVEIFWTYWEVTKFTYVCNYGSYVCKCDIKIMQEFNNNYHIRIHMYVARSCGIITLCIVMGPPKWSAMISYVL